MTSQLASEELYFPFHDIGAPLWKSHSAWSQWDPSRFTENWTTPHLIIHSELDYRLTIAEGLAAFHTLQARGVESQFLTFPDENHWVLKVENSLLWHKVVLDWISKLCYTLYPYILTLRHVLLFYFFILIRNGFYARNSLCSIANSTALRYACWAAKVFG